MNLLNNGSAGSGGGGGGGGVAPPTGEQRQVAIHVTEAERDAINRVIFFFFILLLACNLLAFFQIPKSQIIFKK